MARPIEELHAAVEAAVVATANGHGPRARPNLERPRKAGFGDFATNAALLLAPVLGQPPRDVAARLGDALSDRLGDALERVEVAGPGFLNLFLSDAWHRSALAGVVAAQDAFGARGAAQPERISVEFVSANPTGPLHVGHARNAAYGDALCRILAFHGHAVEREFYVNDFGSQVLRLGESIRARARGEEVPEGGYRGAYVAELAAEIEDAAQRPVEEVARAGVEAMLARIAATLERFGVGFDHWFSERALHEGGDALVREAYAELERQGRIYRSEGALWLRTSQLGDDKDRVLERSSGEHTYFASDVAYHQHKRARGFDRLLDVWGADHHGYVARMKAAFAALGGDPERLELLIMQFVNLTGGASMSKRAGDFVTLDDLVGEVGVDAARWFLLARSHDTTVEFDLDLAREQEPQNPVYYVQYAHARIASLLRAAEDAEREAALAGPDRGAPLEAAERELVKKVLAFPGEVEEAAARRAPHRIAAYALELAQQFSAFYRDCPVLKADSADLRAQRLAVSAATQGTIARALELLGVRAPASM
ncbi:MAG TPA: arginine--tRNA ligase [Solirubrobacteraceae bacterium]|nr:arginine--tRNA ligase [Solirubrobacteraceae bacterium]